MYRQRNATKRRATAVDRWANNNMTLQKICRAIDIESQDWRDYCVWRKRQFSSFDSLDSKLRNSMFDIAYDEDWKHTVTNGSYLTDVINDYNFAQHCAERCGADEILVFDFIENENSTRHILGYEILDGEFSYSLLTNFGNDIDIVNRCLGQNGLIPNKNLAQDVHLWFLDNMPTDHHVIDSRIFTVYETIAQHAPPAGRGEAPRP